jgi:hypothetical protein
MPSARARLQVDDELELGRLYGLFAFELSKPSRSRLLGDLPGTYVAARCWRRKGDHVYAAARFSKRMLVLENRERRDDEVNSPVS